MGRYQQATNLLMKGGLITCLNNNNTVLPSFKTTSSIASTLFTYSSCTDDGSSDYCDVKGGMISHKSKQISKPLKTSIIL